MHIGQTNMQDDYSYNLISNTIVQCVNEKQSIHYRVSCLSNESKYGGTSMYNIIIRCGVFVTELNHKPDVHLVFFYRHMFISHQKYRDTLIGLTLNGTCFTVVTLITCQITISTIKHTQQLRTHAVDAYQAVFAFILLCLYLTTSKFYSFI